MKCPFRTITRTEQLNTKAGTIEFVDFPDCIGAECPWFGKKVFEHRPMGGFEWVTYPACRRVDDQHERKL